MYLIPVLQIQEYCHSLTEQDVSQNAFDLIFAFDEIVALGYRENVNMAQVRTFTEMDSHEERIFEAMRKVSMEMLALKPHLLTTPIHFSHKREKLRRR